MPVRQALPASVQSALDGTDLEARLGQGMLLAVNGVDAPRVAAIGAGEVLAQGEDRIDICLHQGSRTAAELTRRRRGLLLLCDDHRLLRVDTEFEPAGDRVVLGLPVRLFRGRVRSVEVDEVDYASEVSLLDHRILEPDSVLERWRAQIEELRAI